MEKREFNISDDKDLKDSEINHFKDFKKLKHTYNEAVKPLYKSHLYQKRNKKVFIAILLILLITFLIPLTNSNNAKSLKKFSIELKKIEKRVPKIVSF